MPDSWLQRSHDPDAFRRWQETEQKIRKQRDRDLANIFAPVSAPIPRPQSAPPTTDFQTRLSDLVDSFLRKLVPIDLHPYNNPAVMRNGKFLECFIKLEESAAGERYMVEISLNERNQEFAVGAGHAARPPLVDEEVPFSGAEQLLQKVVDAFKQDLGIGSAATPQNPLVTVMNSLVLYLNAQQYIAVHAKISNNKGVDTARITAGTPAPPKFNIDIQFARDQATGDMLGFVDSDQVYYEPIAPNKPSNFVNQVKNALARMIALATQKAKNPGALSAVDLNQTAGFISQFLRNGMRHASYKVTNAVMARAPTDVVTTVYENVGTGDPVVLDIEVSRVGLSGGMPKWRMKVRWQHQGQPIVNEADAQNQSDFYQEACLLLEQITSNPAAFVASQNAPIQQPSAPPKMPISIQDLNKLANDIVYTLDRFGYKQTGHAPAQSPGLMVRYKHEYRGTSPQPHELETSILWSHVTNGFKIRVNWEWHSKPMKAVSSAEPDPKVFYDTARDYLMEIIQNPHKRP